ncbi:MAG: FHA domain-containing protein, partial [Deltaproteobacteria bacterium]|nr:FHA domain-containing protein [Deltaproteobacteria bacterium]
ATDLAPARFPALRHLAITAPYAELDVGQLGDLPLARQLDTLETRLTPTWQRDPRRFLLDRTPAGSSDAAVLDMGCSPSSVAGRVTYFDPTRPLTFGRGHLVDGEVQLPDSGRVGRQGRIEWSGADWSFQASSDTLLDGHPVTHVVLRSGDELQFGPHVFRFVTGDLEPQLAELRARFALPTASPVALRG